MPPDFVSRMAERVKARGACSGPLRLWLAVALGIWKTLRCVPLVNRLRMRTSVDRHTLWVRAFSYDDLLMASPGYEACIREVLPPRGGTAVDVGASIGRHTLTYARAVGPEGRVIAVEPHAQSFVLLKRNVAANGYGQVRCVPVALAAQEGEAWLRFDREASTASLARELPRRQRVRLTTLDRLLADMGIQKLDLLKIDAEGCELEVLEGGAGVLGRSPRATVIVELHSRWRSPKGDACPVKQWLAERGYCIAEREDGRRRFYVAEGAELNLPERTRRHAKEDAEAGQGKP